MTGRSQHARSGESSHHDQQRTVETHVRHILQKLDLPAGSTHNRRVHAVLALLRAGTP